jgi:excisionase family DNA binding protein
MGETTSFRRPRQRDPDPAPSGHELVGDGPRYMTKREVAELLRCSRRSVERLAAEGRDGFPRSCKALRGRSLWLRSAIGDYLRRKAR